MGISRRSEVSAAVTESTYSVAQVPNTVYAWMTSTRVKALNESQLAQDWFCPYCTGPYFQ